MIKKKLIKEINECGFFSVLADEATDCSNVEQMSIVIRFLDKKLVTREEFLGFIHCDTGLKGDALVKTFWMSFAIWVLT